MFWNGMGPLVEGSNSSKVSTVAATEGCAGESGSGGGWIDPI